VGIGLVICRFVFDWRIIRFYWSIVTSYNDYL